MEKSKRIGVYLTITVAIVMAISIGLILNLTPSINNFFQYQYAKFTGQFLKLDQITFFTNLYYPVNSNYQSGIYNSLLNGTLKPSLTGAINYIASTGLSVLPLTTSYTLKTPLTDYVSNIQSLAYSVNKANIPIGNTTHSYIYPLYVVQYTANCSLLSNSQIGILQNTLIREIYFISSCNTTNKDMSFDGIVGISNITSTQLDNIFFGLNNNYTIGKDYLSPLGNTSIINGTLLGYVANTAYPYDITNTTAQIQAIYPIRNVFKGNITNGSVMTDNSYCYNIKYHKITHSLAGAGYTQFPYLYRYLFNNKTYLCLSVNSTNNLLNISANFDGSNIKFNPTLHISKLFNINYILADRIALQENYTFLTQNVVNTINQQISSPYWFIQNKSLSFSLTQAPPYVFSVINAQQYYISQGLPLYGQTPIYTQIPQITISSANTYLYSPLIQNITYQYQFKQPKSGTPVYCTNICQYNNTLVYQDYAYTYQYANPNFGYLVLPKLNQTVYYTPQFTLISHTPLKKETYIYSKNYNKYGYYTGSNYTMQFGLTPQQIFNKGTVNTFTIYERINPKDVYSVNGEDIQGWANFEGYLKGMLKTSNNNLIVTISQLNSKGLSYWSVSGKVGAIEPSFIIISPQTYSINPYAYPPAHSLKYNIYDILAFIMLIIILPYFAYILANAKLN